MTVTEPMVRAAMQKLIDMGKMPRYPDPDDWEFVREMLQAALEKYVTPNQPP